MATESTARIESPPSPRGWRARLVARFARWAARRQGQDVLPIRIDRRRIYILPSRYGWMLAALLVTMLLAGLNYASNLALAYAFLLIALALVSMHHCHRNLLGLELDVNPQADALAGGHAAFQFVLANPSALDRIDIEVGLAAGSSRAIAVRTVRGNGRERLSVEVPTPQRGRLRLDRIELSTRQPLGWFRAWTYVHVPLDAYVAPRPHGERGLPLTAGEDAPASLATGRPGEDELAGLRPYAPGVPLKHMAWKVLAQGRAPAVRSYAESSAEPVWLDWSRLEGLELEARLSQLCRWVLDCERTQQPFGLRLPHLLVAPGSGLGHRQRCLRALALVGEPP